MDRKEHGGRWKRGKTSLVCPNFEKIIKIEKREINIPHINKNKIKNYYYISIQNATACSVKTASTQASKQIILSAPMQQSRFHDLS
jgi:hypothetical protein